MARRPPREEVRIGVSSCLLGQAVRWDGGHRRDAWVAGALSRLATLVPVCPEVEVGMPVPRPPIQLVRRGGETRLVDPVHGIDHTERMVRWAEARARQLARLGLSGYVLKAGSPSCGMARVPVRSGAGRGARTGVGLFARALMARLPLLPVEEEGRLADPRLRESFLERVLAHRRLRSLLSGRWTPGELARFHDSQALLLRAHDPRAVARLARIAAGARRRPRAEVAAAYAEAFMRALRVPSTRAKHAAVLTELAGRLAGRPGAAETARLRRAIAGYRRGRLPLCAPLDLLRSGARRHRLAGLESQAYLEPRPWERRPSGRP
jgi:uncharacterized protein YbbK (DUF523 family)/uncharacterized protein YbgA (DUF1722 family)